jgi:hypothetical protein
MPPTTIKPETPEQRAIREQKEILAGRKPLPAPGTPTGKLPGGVQGNVGQAYIVGASQYGGPGDPSTRGDVGYHSNHLAGKMAFAELEMGHALGNLPYGTKLAIETFDGKKGGKQIVAEKLDIGLGGAPVQGHARRVDLWWETAKALGFNGTGLVRIRRIDGRPISGPNDKEKGDKVEADTFGLPNPLEWTKELGEVLHFILSGSGWLRILKIVGGMVLLVIAVNELMKIGPGVDPLSKAKKVI